MQTEEIAKILIPKKWRDVFELVNVEEKQKEFNMTLREKKSFIPTKLQGVNVVLNGFMEPIEIIDFPLQGKLMYITFLRRRWKKQGGSRSYFNEYEFHRPGMKTTDAFGDFLKELDRKEFDEFCSVWSGIRDFWKKDI